MARRNPRFHVGLLLATSLGAAPAQAQSAVPAPTAPAAREAALEARLAQLEAAVSALRGELDASRAAVPAAVAPMAGAAPAPVQRATNPCVPTFRRGFFTYGNLLVGQEWTTFQNVGVLPETTDFVGPLEGTVFVRQGILQYRLALNSNLDLLLAIENPETEVVNRISPALIDDDDDRVPDIVARLNARTPVGDFSLAGIVRELRVDSAGRGDSAFARGLSAAGRVPIGSRHDFRFMATCGDGIGRYLGLGFARPIAGSGLPPVGLARRRLFRGRRGQDFPTRRFPATR